MFGLSSPAKLAKLSATAAMVLTAMTPALANSAVPNSKGAKPPEMMNSAQTTDRKFNRMRPSMARVLGLETRSAKAG